MFADRFRESQRRPPPVTVAPALSLLKIGAAVALALSTQFFFQPFVWLRWPIDMLLAGWANMAIAQLLLVEPVAVALIAAGWIRVANAGLRVSILGTAIICGAVIGDELVHLYIGVAPTPVVVLLQSLRVALTAASVMTILAIWRIGMQTAAKAAALGARRASARAAADLNELEALRRQIDPHFLFNTLATVRALQDTDGAAGYDLLARLLTYIRRSGASAGGGCTRLGDEVSLVEAYLAICRSRMADRLSTRIETPAILADAEVPPLILITLVENAIKHGLGPSPSGGSISVVARRDGEMLELLVADDGVGLGAPSSGDGIGLANTLRRLRLTFGERTSLRLYANAPRGACAHVRLPLRLAA